MAIPASGNLSIRNAAGTCRNICTAVIQGGHAGASNLRSLTTQAIPIMINNGSMSQFYGYSPVDIWINYGSQTNTCCVGTCVDIQRPLAYTGRDSGEIITNCFNICTSLGIAITTCFSTRENGGLWFLRCCTTGSISSSFAVTGIDYNDTLDARITMQSSFGGSGTACLELQDPPAVFTTGSGTICRCGINKLAAIITG